MLVFQEFLPKIIEIMGSKTLDPFTKMKEMDLLVMHALDVKLEDIEKKVVAQGIALERLIETLGKVSTLVERITNHKEKS